MHVFLAGIMQGSREDHLIGDQDYRSKISDALKANIPGVQITDPYLLDPGSVDYDLTDTRRAFKANTAIAADADVLIAYLPQASMGTAIEMWTAFNANKYIIAVTQLKHNWVIRVTADAVLPDLDSLIELIESGGLARISSSDGRRPLTADNLSN